MKTNFLFLGFFVFLFFSSFFAPSVAYADAVYLKNGKVMQGRIVEKNERFLVLKTGEGEEATKATIFLEDINRIETEEQYANETKLIPVQFPKSSAKMPWETNVVPFRPKEGLLNIKTASKGSVKDFVKEGNILVLGGGSISGFVKLPEEMAEYRGPLYVYLAKEMSDGSRMIASGLPYQKIETDAINSMLIFYKIKHVPAGVYKVYAEWDIARPLMQEKAMDGKEMLVGFGLKGDYFGAYSGSVSLAAEENKEDINFDCQSYLEKDAPGAFPVPKTVDFKVLDLYVRQQPPKKPALVVRLKNTGEIDIFSLSLDIFINGESVNSEPYVLGMLPVNADKEFDITPMLDSYRKEKQRKRTSTWVPQMLRFKLLKPKTGELALEKVVFVP